MLNIFLKIINYLFSMIFSLVKASLSYKNLMNLPKEVLINFTQGSIILNFVSHLPKFSFFKQWRLNGIFQNFNKALHSELFSKIRVEFWVGMSFSRVRECSKSSELTEIFPKFEKRQFPKLAKTKISEKNV